MDGNAGDNPEAWPNERYAWFVVFLFFLAYTLSFIDRQILTLMVDPIRQDLRLSDTQFSLLHGLAFAIFYTFLGLPCGWAADRYNRIRIAAAGIALWSLMTALCGFAKNYSQLFLARMSVGIGEAALSPAVFSVLADYFPKEKLGRALSFYSMGITIGAGLALVFGGLVVEAASAISLSGMSVLGGLRTWQVVFVLLGLPGVLFGLLVLTIREPVRRGRAHDLRPLSIAQVATAMIIEKRIWLCYFVGLALFTAIGHGTMAWAPAYLARSQGWPASEIGFKLGILQMVLGSSGLLLGGWLSDRWVRAGLVEGPLRASLIGLCFCGPCAIAATLVSGGNLAALLFGLFFFFYMFPWGVVGAAISQVLPNEMRAQVAAVYLFTINIIGLGLGPTLVALLSDTFFDGPTAIGKGLALTVSMIAPVGAALIFAALRPYREAAIRPAFLALRS